MLINPFTPNTGYWQIYVGYIFARNASSPHRDEVTTDLMLVNMRNNIQNPDTSFLCVQKYHTLSQASMNNFFRNSTCSSYHNLSKIILHICIDS